MSRALLALPKERIKKLIIIEDAVSFVPFIEVHLIFYILMRTPLTNGNVMQPLEELDPRVKFVQKMAKQWSTYNDLEDEGILSEVKTLPWENGQCLSQPFTCVHPKPDTDYAYMPLQCTTNSILLCRSPRTHTASSSSRNFSAQCPTGNGSSNTAVYP